MFQHFLGFCLELDASYLGLIPDLHSPVERLELLMTTPPSPLSVVHMGFVGAQHF